MSKTIPQILLLQVSVPHYSLALFARFICTCTTFAKKKKFAFKQTLDSFPVILRGLRANENNVNDSIYCREET